MRTTLSLILVAALAISAMAASKYRPYNSASGQVQTAPKNPNKPAVTEFEKKLAEDEKLDIRKMTQQLQQNGSKK